MKRSFLALALIAAAPFAANAADGISYNHVQGGYVNIDRDALTDSQGTKIDASVAVHPNIHVFGSAAREDLDGTDLELDTWTLGAGWNKSITQNADVVTRLGYERRELESLKQDGGFAEAGVRVAANEHLDAYALGGYQDRAQEDGEFFGRVGANVKFNQNWGLNGDVKVSESDTQYFIGPRFSW